jgi:putative oxidoreductase
VASGARLIVSLIAGVVIFRLNFSLWGWRGAARFLPAFFPASLAKSSWEEVMSETVEREAVGADLALLVGRILLALIFIPAGFHHLTNSSGFAGYLDAHGVPLSSVVAVVAGCVEFFGALAILLGFGTRYAAPLLALFSLIAALVGHRYWNETGAQYANQYNHFFKDVAITGGFLVLYAVGPGRWSIDRRGR